ncbi:hypothetical protein V8G54_009390 [Vigna mungo]|uniref:Transposase-associated domain-containing protein n=1 Tax=Vigna mungo TaxID=3915 RepID=A0AAQ3NVP8_VIGMU
MDQSWMNARRISEEYEKGVSSVNGTYFCPCVCCLNQIRQDLGNLHDHLFMFGITRTYTVWTWHGEVLDQPMMSQGTNYVEEWMSDHLEDMKRDVGEDNFRRANLYDSLINDSEQPFFTELLELLKEMLPKNNTLPIRNYEAKKVLCPMGLEYHALVIVEGGQTIHGVPISPHHMRVMIDEVRDPQAQVHVPTPEVQFVGEAIGSFLAWPKTLVITHIGTQQFTRPQNQPMHEAPITSGKTLINGSTKKRRMYELVVHLLDVTFVH